MMARREFLRGACLLPAAACVATRAHACGLDGNFDGGIGFIHPRAIEVALAVRKAVTDEILPTTALAPLKAGPESLWSATGALTRFGHRLVASPRLSPLTKPNIALLVSNATLWTRYAANSEGFSTSIHAMGPMLGDIEVISELAVLIAINDAQLPMKEALARGLLIIDARGALAQHVTELFTKSFAETTLSAPLNIEDRTAWRRPARN